MCPESLSTSLTHHPFCSVRERKRRVSLQTLMQNKQRIQAWSTAQREVKIPSLLYQERKLLCDYDEMVKLQLWKRVMGGETTAV